MSQITLIRHGQANSGAQHEESYDKLSDLGHQQAKWLGAHLHQTGEHYTRVYCGTMRRHLETATSMGASRFSEIQRDARLNEFPYFSMAQAMQRQFKFPAPSTREEFAAQIKPMLAAWQANELEGVSESCEAFSARVYEVIDDISSGKGPALVVTSGGFISCVLRGALSLDVAGWSKMCLAIMNTSVHRWQRIIEQPIITQFNAVPHLEMPERRYAQSHL